MNIDSKLSELLREKQKKHTVKPSVLFSEVSTGSDCSSDTSGGEGDIFHFRSSE